MTGSAAASRKSPSRRITEAGAAGGAPIQSRSAYLSATKSIASLKTLRQLSKTSKQLVERSSSNIFMRDEEKEEDEQNNAYTELLQQHMQTLIAVDEDAEADNLAGFDPAETAGSSSPTAASGGAAAAGGSAAAAAAAAQRLLPSPRLRIRLLHSSSLNRGLAITAAEQFETNAPTWDNLGELYFRGTLRDLDSTYLEVQTLNPKP